MKLVYTVLALAISAAIAPVNNSGTLLLPAIAKPPEPVEPDWERYHDIEIQFREGIALMPYLDETKWAVGLGTRIPYEEARQIEEAGGITIDEARYRSKLILGRIRKELEPDLQGMSVPQQIAVIDLAYTTGVRGMKEKRVWDVIVRRDTSQEACDLWLKTAARIPGNARARKVEVALWRQDTAALNALTEYSLRGIKWRLKKGITAYAYDTP